MEFINNFIFEAKDIEEEKITIEISAKNEYQINKMLKIFRTIQLMGGWGTGRNIQFYIDGDGEDRYRYLANGEEIKIDPEVEQDIKDQLESGKDIIKL